MAFEVYQFNEAILVTSAQEGDPDAKAEVLTRNIMATDEVEWEEARKKMVEMHLENLRYMEMAAAPYTFTFWGCAIAGLATFPLVFDLNTAGWFNENFVTAELYDDGEADTWLEVGSWTWNWMEPPLGQLSFALLAYQVAMDSLDQVGSKPMSDRIKTWRANRLASLYPDYNRRVLEDFSRADDFSGTIRYRE